MSYQIFMLRSAQKELAALQREYYDNVKASIRELSMDPRPGSCRKLVGRNGWRIRAGNYRVIYDIDDGNKTITILHIGHRRDIYR